MLPHDKPKIPRPMVMRMLNVKMLSERSVFVHTQIIRVYTKSRVRKIRDTEAFTYGTTHCQVI